jgi:cysteinyl-tRNA synthetase
MNVVVQIANALLKDLEKNDKLIEEKKIKLESLIEFSVTIKESISSFQSSLDDDFNAEEKLKKVNSYISTLISSLDSSVKFALEDVMKMEATQDGMKRALLTVKEAGESISTQKNDG